MGPRVVLYSRPGCHLCEAARELLERLQPDYGYQLEEVDIATNDDLLARFQSTIPVVEIDGQVVAESVVTLEQTREAFQRHQQQRASDAGPEQGATVQAGPP